jgi:sulfur dioxygenase
LSRLQAELCVIPVLEKATRDAQLVNELGFKLKFALNTHCHADHITGTGYLKQLLPGVLSMIGTQAGSKADKMLEDGDEVQFGRHKVVALSTPGHTNGKRTHELIGQFSDLCLRYRLHDLREL